MNKEIEKSDSNGDVKPDNHLPVPVPDNALTLSEKRLAGSVACMNCGTELQGPFCHFCGQPDKNFLRFFPVLMRELLEDFLDFDSRFMRTLKPLIFKPGKLTSDYLNGRRFRYVPPLRLYIFSSIAFFFLAALLAGSAIQLQVNGDGDVVTGIHIGETEQREMDEALEKLEDLDPALAGEIKGQIKEITKNNQAVNDDKPAMDSEEGASEEIEDISIEEDGINIDGKPWDRETNPFIIEWLPNWVNEWVNDEIEESPQKGKEIEANPDLIKDKVFDVMPIMMFVLLPIVALLFKFWYLFARKFYIEHLIFALHNHSFIFVAALLMMLLGSLAEWLDPSGEGKITTATELSTTVIAVWIPVYLLVSLKRVYQQGWGMTLLKYGLIGTSYAMLLGMATVLVALLSFVML
jgi:hypothetical protein